jgi:hypothetical protein
VQKISGIQVDALLPGHGQICMKDASELLRDACVRARLHFAHAPVLDVL